MRNGLSVRPPQGSSPGPAVLLALLIGACHSSTTTPPTQSLVVSPTFTFESGPVRPLAMSPDGTQLFVANTSNGSLDIFKVAASGPSFAESVYVGIDPVAVAARSNTEVWVVNQVSDSVSVVDVSSTPPHVARTLLVGDEPSDIVFGGVGNSRAFITTAHRGQQRTDPSLSQVPGAGDPELTTPGVGRADVWVFDATALGSTLGGTPLAILSLFGDTPRALAVTPDGGTIYVAVFKSGNQTTATSSELPCDGFDITDAGTPCTVLGVAVPGAPPGPATNYAGLTAPKVAVILKSDAEGTWRDVLGRDWTAATAFSLPDQDVFAVDAMTLATTASYAHVGTTLFNMAVNPVSGLVYVSNTEARNDLRFEGPGTFAGQTLQGHLAEARITVLTSAGAAPRHLNKHINYSVLPASAATLQSSLSMPLQLAVSADGQTVYVAAFGSSKVGVFPTAAIENDSFDPVSQSSIYLSVSGGGPGGLALDEVNQHLYVTTRFDNGLSVIDLASGIETAHLSLANPEPAVVTAGRPFLYDSTRSSSNGEASCASCHMFGDKDNLIWDLGNPDADPVQTPINIKLSAGAGATINGGGKVAVLHPMKGPMSTQTLRGMVNNGPMHWRGDRAVGFFGSDTSTAPPYDSMLAFKNFIVAFNSLLGLGPAFSSADMQTFADFALDIAMPPNPVRALDNSLTPAQAAGRAFFLGCDGLDSLTATPVQCPDGGTPATGGHLADGIPISMLGFTCQGCHILNPAMGFFGTDGESSFEALPQTTKIPQLRNLYDKVGMFGVPPNLRVNTGNNGNMGPQVRGGGFEHDGSVDTLFRFLQAQVFNAADAGILRNVGFTDGDVQRRNVEQYLLAFDSDLAPIVGQQVTLRSDNAASVGPRIDLFISRATTPYASKLVGPNSTECDLVARCVVDGAARTFFLQQSQTFMPDDGSGPLSDSALRALAATPGQEVTYTCLPPGWVSTGPSR
jgi:YVTN family beta-propeller protein